MIRSAPSPTGSFCPCPEGAARAHRIAGSGRLNSEPPHQRRRPCLNRQPAPGPDPVLQDDVFDPARHHRPKVAERQGFEPWVGSPPQRFSKPPRSTTPAPLREGSRLDRRPAGAVQPSICSARSGHGGLDRSGRLVDKPGFRRQSRPGGSLQLAPKGRAVRGGPMRPERLPQGGRRTRERQGRSNVCGPQDRRQAIPGPGGRRAARREARGRGRRKGPVQRHPDGRRRHRPSARPSWPAPPCRPR